MRCLFLVDEAGSRDESTLDKLRTLRGSSEVVVLSLDTLVGLALRRMGVPYVTPDLFFKKEKSNAMDKQSAAFSTGWYKSLDNPLVSYHGVSIGEVLEYDFYFLFIDAIRSVEIANGLLQDSFDVIYMPSPDPRYVGHSACYNTFPSVLEHLAGRAGVKVVRLDGAASGRTGTARRADRRRKLSGLLSHNRRLPISGFTFLRENLWSLVAIFLKRGMKRHALAYEDRWLRASLNDAHGRGLMTRPDSIHTPTSLAYAERLLECLTDERIALSLDDTVVYDGVQLWRVLSSHINEMLSELVPSIVGRVRWTELLLKMIRPDSFTVLEDISTLQRSMCQFLKSRGVPVIVVQHGILTNDFAGFYVMPKVGDVQAVWGEYYKRWHTDRAKAADSQAVTGFPRYDGLVTMPPFDRDGVCSRFGLNPDLRVVLVATEWFQAATSRYTIEDDEKYIRFVLKSLKSHDDIQIVVKLHPGFQDRFQKIVSEIAAQEGAKVIIAKDSLWDLIRLSSLVIVAISSVCVEALVLGKPVISIDVNDCRDLTGLVQDELAIGAYDEAGISRSIASCLEMAERTGVQIDRTRAQLVLFVYSTDGHASQRVAELIKTRSTKAVAAQGAQE